MVEREFTVTGQLGLHARAAAKLVRMASDFASALTLERKDTGAKADAKSILSVLMLAASCGVDLIARAEGSDEHDAIEALDHFFASGFGEASTIRPATVERSEIHWKGLGVSEGVAIGRVFRMHDGATYVYRSRIDAGEIDRELRRFHAARRLASRQLKAIKERAEHDLGRDHASVFDAHLLLLEDEKLLGEVEKYISVERANAEWAVRMTADHLLSVYSDIKDDYLRERGSDIEDVAQRLLLALSGERLPHRQMSKDAVVVSQDLLPSVVAGLDFEFARALATDSGGWTSHTAIIARGLGIPAVVGLRDFFRRARTGDEIIVDSFRGEVILHPSRATREQYRSETASRATTPPVDLSGELGPLRTLDGVEIRLRANVEVPAEFAGVSKYGADGVGLYRSEFLLSRTGVMVSEDEQYAAYTEIARLAGDRGAIIRLFDRGGENLPDLALDPERNPALGLRAIRFGLSYENVMRTQVRAILRAAADGRLGIVLPMVSDVGDVRRARAIINDEQDRVKRESKRHGDVNVGAMIEVPSAVLTASKIAQSVDFFELGTNDLVQYTLAVDRTSDQVADWFRTLHPGVLNSILRCLQAAQETRIPAIVCGEMASTPSYATLLIGLGAVDLSMTPASIPRVRRALSGIHSQEARAVAFECLECATADEVEDLVRVRFRERWPGIFPLESLPQPK
ncbi:MAG TPA: phosphoenolpyruvate--protein phosphotransferase [Pyrinomonadaceae bacterium]|nr:phosphoenolpyruvate--protein phosphotransferase [Pyrinomonadaceae bacterium]